MNKPKKDTIIKEQALMLDFYKQEVTRITLVNNDLKRKKRNAWIFGGISGIIVTSAIAVLVGISTK